MHRALTAAASGIAGAAIGACGWAMLGPAKTIHDTAATGSPAAVHSTAPHYASAQAIADKLAAAGFNVSMLHKRDIASPDMGMDAAYDFTVSTVYGKPAPGDSSINLFRNHDALDTWTGLSQAFGGIAVTGDTWAVSLATRSAAAVNLSKQMAPRIAKVLGGTVVK